jgi:hypothetical protein
MACSRHLRRLLLIILIMRTVLVKEQTGFVDVGAEEGGVHQGDAHYFGGGEPDLGSSRWRVAFEKSSHEQ